MCRIILAILLLPVTSLLGCVQTTRPDMTVFGYSLGEKLSIPECPCRIVESKLEGEEGVVMGCEARGFGFRMN